MDDHSLLRPKTLNTEPNQPDSEKAWKHFYKTFKNLIDTLEENNKHPNKLRLLTNSVSPEIYPIIEECTTYEKAVEALESVYVKPVNTLYYRHLLATKKQETGDSLDEFLQKLKTLAKQCSFQAVTADKNRDDSIREAFIQGLTSDHIRQRLLESGHLELTNIFQLARTLEVAQKSSEGFKTSSFACATQPQMAPNQSQGNVDHVSDGGSETLAALPSKCFYCGYNYHPRNHCPARNQVCRRCGVQGHFDKVCQRDQFRNRSRPSDRDTRSRPNRTAAVSTAVLPNLSAVNASTQSVKSMVKVDIEGTEFDALVDSGSDLTFGHPEVVKSKNLKTYPTNVQITMADTGVVTKISLFFKQDIVIQKKTYKQVKFLIMPGLCADLILGRDFQSRHQSVVVQYGGVESPLVIGALGTLRIEPSPLFPHLSRDCKPIITKSRWYSLEDRQFIETEVNRLEKEGIIEKSDSPWRAQVVVDKSRTKKRMCIDYSTTINTYTHLDAYPLPLMKDVINNIAQHKIYSTLDLRSAFNQIPLIDDEKKYTAFEAGGQIYQFTRLPFGVTNGVTMFQRTMDSFI